MEGEGRMEKKKETILPCSDEQGRGKKEQCCFEEGGKAKKQCCFAAMEREGEGRRSSSVVF
jgi:hypothetical protein